MKKLLLLTLVIFQYCSWSVCPMSWEAYGQDFALYQAGIEVESYKICDEKAKKVKATIKQVQDYSDKYFSSHHARIESDLFNRAYIAFFIYEMSETALHRYLDLPENVPFTDIGGIYLLGKREMWMPIDVPKDEFVTSFVHELTHAMDDRTYLRRHGYDGEYTEEFVTFYQVAYEARAFYRQFFYEGALEDIAPDFEKCESNERVEKIRQFLSDYYFSGNLHFKKVWEYVSDNEIYKKADVLSLSDLYHSFSEQK